MTGGKMSIRFYRQKQIGNSAFWIDLLPVISLTYMHMPNRVWIITLAWLFVGVNIEIMKKQSGTLDELVREAEERGGYDEQQY